MQRTAVRLLSVALLLLLTTSALAAPARHAPWTPATALARLVAWVQSRLGPPLPEPPPPPDTTESSTISQEQTPTRPVD